MSWLDRLIEDVVKLPVKTVLLPFRVLCATMDGSHQWSAWEYRNGRWTRSCDLCAAQETK